MKNSEYWQKRNIQLEKAAHSYGMDTYRKIEPAFTKAQRDIQKELEAWYGRFAVNNNVSIQEAKRLLNSSELKELKWDVQEYIEHCKENEINQMWVKQLENASAKYHISRLEALKIRTQQAAELAFGNEVDCIDDMAAKVFTNSYYHQMYEVQKGFNVGWDIGTIDNKKLNKIITKPWTADGKNFSDRIWQSKQQLITELHNELTRNCILGEAPDRLINSIAKKFDVAKSQASRLVMTEQAYFHSAAQKEAYNDLDVEEYQIVATLDNRTSAICQSLDLKHFPMSEYKEGSTAPPFHPHCRSVTVPYFDDEFTKDEMRAARDEKGKTYYVPADMSYDEWAKKHIKDATSEKDLQAYNNVKSIIGNKYPNTIEEFKKIKYNSDKETYKFFNAYVSAVNRGELTPLADFDLYMEISKEIDDKIVGIITSNGIKINGKSYHFISRVIGSVEQRRNGVTIDDIIDCLTSEASEVLPLKILKNGKSQKFRSKTVEVTVNPVTGNLIQVNPVRKKV